MIAKLARYSLATIGPIGSAGAQFALSLVLLHQLNAAEFGRFSFLLIILQLSWGIWGALFCAPLPALLANRPADGHEAVIRCLISANGVGAALAFVVFASIALLVGVTPPAVLLYAACGSLAVLRWYARAQCYATANAYKPVVSDALYAGSLLLGILAMAMAGVESLESVFALLLASTALAMLPFGFGYLGEQFFRNPLRGLGDYGAVWRQHARWSLMGVITTEATANAHVYLVTFVFGPGAYAPLAASALLIRPVQVAMNALSEFERAQMARQIGERRFDLAKSSVRFFRGVLLAIWGVTGIVLIAVLALAPRLVFPPQYDMAMLVAGSALWMAVALVRLLRTPESVLLQAGGAFRPLASASVLSAVASVIAVALLMAMCGALWSIAGILLGEFLFAWRIWQQASRWRKDRAIADEDTCKFTTR